MPSFTEVVEWFISPGVSRILLTSLLIYLALVWIALIIWVTKDILSRTNNVVYQIVSILLIVLLNVFGLIIYFGIRPSKTLIEKFFEDLEYEALVEATKKPIKELIPQKNVKNNKKRKRVRSKSKEKKI